MIVNIDLAYRLISLILHASQRWSMLEIVTICLTLNSSPKSYKIVVLLHSSCDFIQLSHEFFLTNPTLS